MNQENTHAQEGHLKQDIGLYDKLKYICLNVDPYSQKPPSPQAQIYLKEVGLDQIQDPFQFTNILLKKMEAAENGSTF